MVGKSHGIERWLKLTGQVQLYASALINFYNILPFEYDYSGGVDTSFGQNAKQFAKDYRKNAKGSKKKTYTAPQELIDSLYSSGRSFSQQQLAELAEKAKLAAGEASQLVGEPVYYCCGMLRRESRAFQGEYCNCKNREVNKIINEQISARER